MHTIDIEVISHQSIYTLCANPLRARSSPVCLSTSLSGPCQTLVVHVRDSAYIKYRYRILCFVDRESLYNLVHKAKLVHSFSYYVYFFSLHVSGNYVPIIRRNNCIYGTLRICHSTGHTRQ